MVLKASTLSSIPPMTETNHEAAMILESRIPKKTSRRILSCSWVFPVLCGLLGALALSTAFSTRSTGSHSHIQSLALGYQPETVMVENSGVPSIPMIQPQLEEHRPIAEKSNMCVPGGGFSGFWFTLGQLQSLGESKSSFNYYCYSAGCLCVAAFLADLPVDQVLDVSLTAQALWQNGNITRFQVVPYFVDEMIELMVKQDKHLREKFDDSLLAGTNATCSIREKNDDDRAFIPYKWLDSLRIITGVKRDSGWGLDAAVRTPTPDNIHGLDSESSSSALASFRKMLLQTVWIPFAIGDKLFLENHIDGAFVRRRVEHQCQHSVDFVYQFDLIWHSLNTNLSKDLAMSFLEKGRHHEAISSASSSI